MEERRRPRPSEGLSRDKRRALGERLKALRKARGWTMERLAAELGVTASQVNKYEGGWSLPPTLKLVHLSELFDTSLDELVFGVAGLESLGLTPRLLQRLERLARLAGEHQQTLVEVIDAWLLKREIERALPGRGQRKR